MNQYCIRHTRVQHCTTLVVADNEELALSAFNDDQGDLEVHNVVDLITHTEEII